MSSFFHKILSCVLTFMEAVKAHAVRFLVFMRLVGDDHCWDWTTAALVGVLFVLCVRVQNPGLPEVMAFFLALAARAHKKHLGAKVQGEVSTQLADMKAAADIAIKEAKDKADQAIQAMNEVKTRFGFEDMVPWSKK